VLLVKLADRLHNMRTLGFIKNPEKRRRIAQRDGGHLRAARRAASACTDARGAGRSRLRRTRSGSAQFDRHAARLRDAQGRRPIGRIADQLKRKLAERASRPGSTGRGKRPYSIWRKLQDKKLNFEQLSDIFGFRVIVDDRGLLPRAGRHPHQLAMVPERFKDFISTPKPNGYRSIHTTVIGPEKQRVESRSAPGDARRGRARRRRALALSRACRRAGSTGQRAYGWLRDMVDLLERGDSPRKFLEHSRLTCTRTRSSASRPRAI
jgi:GTP diphosphokinase / guanosine-3',5'-bis(diphosphate) 3'-diphosphatase